MDLTLVEVARALSNSAILEGKKGAYNNDQCCAYEYKSIQMQCNAATMWLRSSGRARMLSRH